MDHANDRMGRGSGSEVPCGSIPGGESTKKLHEVHHADPSSARGVQGAGTDENQGGNVGRSTSGKKKTVTRDGFGFVVPTPYISLYRDFRVVYDVEEEHRTKSWTTWLASYGGCLARALEAVRLAKLTSRVEVNQKKVRASLAGDPMPHHELGVLVRAGVPKGMRGEVWQACLVEGLLEQDKEGESGQPTSNRMLSGYKALVDQIEGCEYQDDMQQIEKDLHRTFPNHALTNDACGKARLRRVLGAYAVRNPLVGYCQGLNFIAAMFLLVFVDGAQVGGEEGGGAGGAGEAAAFWCFAALVEQILTGYFDPMMINQQVDGLVFEQVVREVMSDVAAHFDHVGVHVPTAVAGWFLVAFVNSLPSESTMRVWDVLFYEKSPAVLFQVGLGLLSLYKEAIFECRNDSDLYMLIQAIGPITFNASSLVESMEDFSHITKSVVQVLRDKYAPGVTKVMERMFDAGADHKRHGGLGSGGMGSSSGSACTNGSSHSSQGSSRGSSRAQKLVTNAMSKDIERRLGILRIRHKDPVAAIGQPGHVLSGQDQQRINQESLRRTQSALTNSTPGISLEGRNERLQQQLRINLLAMRTFVPDMELLTTALRIASGNTSDDNDGRIQAGSRAGTWADRGEGHQETEMGEGTATSHLAVEATMETKPNNGTARVEPEGKPRAPDLKSSTKLTPVTRRFTDGGALLASPFHQGGHDRVAATTGFPAVSVVPVTASIPNPGAPPMASSQLPMPVHPLPLEKLRNIESIKSALTTEVSRSIQLLDEISASNRELEKMVSDVGDQLFKVQDEIGHKVSTYDALFLRATELQEQTNAVEVAYRKQLASNMRLADSWRTISKEIKKNDTTLKMLMDLAESRASMDPSTRIADQSPTKAFKQRARAMVNRKFTQ